MHQRPPDTRKASFCEQSLPLQVFQITLMTGHVCFRTGHTKRERQKEKDIYITQTLTRNRPGRPRSRRTRSRSDRTPPCGRGGAFPGDVQVGPRRGRDPEPGRSEGDPARCGSGMRGRGGEHLRVRRGHAGVNRTRSGLDPTSRAHVTHPRCQAIVPGGCKARLPEHQRAEITQTPPGTTGELSYKSILKTEYGGDSPMSGN